MNIHSVIALGKELEKTQEAADDLWTWLPSYKVCQKHHGDYSFNFMPSLRDIIIEATMYISSLQGHEVTDDKKEWWVQSQLQFERCPCGESHE
jgi:hypothetical protein